MNRARALTLTAAALLLSSVSAASAATVFANSFAPGGSDAAVGSFRTVAATGTLSNNVWTVSSNSVDWIGSYWQSADGDGYSLDLSGNTAQGTPGQITTSFATTAGEAYAVSYYVSGNPDGPPPVKSVTVAVNGAPASDTVNYDTTTSGNSLSDMKWELHSFQFVASSGTTTLSFTGGETSSYGAALDNITVNQLSTNAAVPLPTSAAAGSVLLVGLLRNRRR